MKCEVMLAEFFLGTVEHRADAAHFYVGGVGQFSVGQSRRPQDEKLRLHGFDRGKHGTYPLALFFAHQIVQRTTRLRHFNAPSSCLLMLTSSVGGSQDVDAEVSSGAVQPTTDIAIGLQTGLPVQAPKGIVGYFFRLGAVAEQARGDPSDPGIVLQKQSPEVSVVPMLG